MKREVLETLPSSVQEARDLGAKRYYTCKPCIHGHLSERFTVSQQCVECARIQSAVTRAKDPVGCKQKATAYRSAHPERNRDSVRRWIERNPEEAKRVRKQAQWKYRAKQHGLDGVFTVAEFEALKDRHGHICLSCGKHESEVALHADHIVPVKQKGLNTIENIQPLCDPCNNKKGQATTDFRPDRGECV